MLSCLQHGHPILTTSQFSITEYGATVGLKCAVVDRGTERWRCHQDDAFVFCGTVKSDTPNRKGVQYVNLVPRTAG